MMMCGMIYLQRSHREITGPMDSSYIWAGSKKSYAIGRCAETIEVRSDISFPPPQIEQCPKISYTMDSHGLNNLWGNAIRKADFEY